MFLNTFISVTVILEDSKAKKNYAWNDAKTKKWHTIQQEFQMEIQCPVDVNVVRNRWNVLTREYKQTKRIINTYCASSANNEILPTAIINKFSESPMILSQ